MVRRKKGRKRKRRIIIIIRNGAKTMSLVWVVGPKVFSFVVKGVKVIF
jgi:hypothetical protein